MMKSIIVSAFLLSLARGHLAPRSVGSSCTTPDGAGTCQSTSNCKGWSIPGPLPGYCPNDPNDVQCCVEKTCSPPGQSGICQNTDKPCPGGQYNGGDYCPGDSTIQCCPTSGSSSSSSTDGVGQACHPPGQTGVCQKTTTSTCAAGFNGGGYCPGDNTIQCCPNSPSSAAPKSSPPPTTPVPAPAPANDCSAPVRDTCNFYPDCLESKYNCGPSGYPLGYGLKYCNLFTAAKSRLDAKGVQWVSDTMLCLQTALVPFATTETTTCSDLKSTAFASHPRCYVDSGVCTLGPDDWYVIVTTVSPKDLFGGVDNLKAVLETVGDCTEFYAWLIEQGFLAVVNKVEDGAKDIWHKLTSWI